MILRLPKTHRDHLQTVYNSHMLHSQTADPFKLALYKLIGKLEPSRRSVAQVTTTIEDWLWFQLTMVDEDEEGGLRGLADVLLGYGERHFDGVPGQKGSRRGVWAGVLLMCGQFERVCSQSTSCFNGNSDFRNSGCRCALGISRDRSRSCSSRYCSRIPRPSQAIVTSRDFGYDPAYVANFACCN